jgi:hypothetical protein
VKLKEEEFNDGFKMMQKLKSILRPATESEFMRLCQEYYSLSYERFENVDGLLTHVKLLEEKMDATKVKLTNDRRTILCLSMALSSSRSSDRYRSLIQLWSLTPDMTAQKAATMLREEEKRSESDYVEVHYAKSKKRATDSDLRCSFCRKKGHTEDFCWNKHPELCPEKHKHKLEGGDTKDDEGNWPKNTNHFSL